MNITTEELKALLHKAYLEGQTGYQDLRDETIDGIVSNFIDGEQIVRQSNWKAYPAAYSDDSDDDDWDQDWETPNDPAARRVDASARALRDAAVRLNERNQPYRWQFEAARLVSPRITLGPNDLFQESQFIEESIVTIPAIEALEIAIQDAISPLIRTLPDLPSTIETLESAVQEEASHWPDDPLL